VSDDRIPDVVAFGSGYAPRYQAVRSLRDEWLVVDARSASVVAGHGANREAALEDARQRNEAEWAAAAARWRAYVLARAGRPPDGLVKGES
jgi:hypothetical protein